MNAPSCPINIMTCLNYNQMKEDLSQQYSEERTEQTAKHRKERMQKNRAIRKQKVVSCEVSPDLRTSSLRTLTLEQRNQRQKLKNRQAAQKSRENKRSYLTSLEMENKELKRQLSAMRYCEQCKNELGHSVKALQYVSLKEDSLQGEMFDEELMRVSHFEEPSSLGIFLFVCMIVVCVFTLIGANPKAASVGIKRDLIQLHDLGPVSQPVLQVKPDLFKGNKNWGQEQMERCRAEYGFDSKFQCESLTDMQWKESKSFQRLIAKTALTLTLNSSIDSIAPQRTKQIVEAF